MAHATQALKQELGNGLKRILVATDFSESSRQSLPYALELAQQFSSEVYLAHVLQSFPEPVPLARFPAH